MAATITICINHLRLIPKLVSSFNLDSPITYLITQKNPQRRAGGKTKIFIGGLEAIFYSCPYGRFALTCEAEITVNIIVQIGKLNTWFQIMAKDINFGAHS